MRLLSLLTILGMFLTGTTEAKNTQKGNSKSFSKDFFDVNNCYIPITNYGEFGYMYGIWPKGAGEAYIFGSGLWIGGIRGGAKMVSCGYNSVGAGNDFMPGPPEHNQDHVSNPTSHPEDRVLSALRTEDLAIWPNLDSLGAPILLSHKDMWCEYNDCAESRHTWDPGTKPLNLHVKQLTFGWTTELYANMFFLLYEIKNVGDKTLNNLYVGNSSDMDIGDATNDLVGCDVGRSLGYTYTTVQEQGWQSKPPYYVGVRFLKGPRADDTVYVSAPPGATNPNYPNTIMDTVFPGEELVLSSFNRCTINLDADNDEKRYLMLSGYNIETQQYDPWQGVLDDKPDDKRQVMGCGPFTLKPGEVDTFLVAVMFSNGNTGGLNYLLSEGDAAKAAYDAGWVVPAPPSTPKFSATPGNQKATIMWDNSPVYEKDPFATVMRKANDSLYKEYDFEGFRLWRSRTALPNDWELLGEWDIKNDITLLPGDMWIRNADHPNGFNVSGDNSNNAGLEFSYVDTNVINGITYFYAVTSFDFNTKGAIPNESDIKVSLESGKTYVKCTPRAEAGNFVNPTINQPALASGSCTSLDSFKIDVLGAVGVTGDAYKVEWGNIKENNGLPVYTYNIFNSTSGKYLSPVEFEVPTSNDIYASEKKTISRTKDSIIEGTPDTATCDSIIIRRTTVWDTVNIDSIWRYAGSFNNPFDGMMLSGKVDINLNERKSIFKVEQYKTLVVKPDFYGKWTDTTLKSTTADTTTFIDTSYAYFGLPDSIKVVKDSGAHTYNGIPTISKFFSGGINGNNWAYHGGRDIEIKWDYYHNSPDSMTIRVFDVLTGLETPYDSAFGENWCFCYAQKPANQYLTGTQIPLYRLWFYVTGVWYFFNNGAQMTWANQPDSGDVWRIYSSKYTIPPFKGTTYNIGTGKFAYSDSINNMDLIKVVPNPYIIRTDWDRSDNTRKIQFTHLPSECTIRIYTLSGTLIRKLEHTATSETGGVEEWNIRTQDDQIPASGVYIYSVSTPNGKKKLGKFALLR